MSKNRQCICGAPRGLELRLIKPPAGKKRALRYRVVCPACDRVSVDKLTSFAAMTAWKRQTRKEEKNRDER